MGLGVIYQKGLCVGLRDRVWSIGFKKKLSCSQNLRFVPIFVFRYLFQLEGHTDISHGHIRLPALSLIVSLIHSNFSASQIFHNTANITKEK